MRALYEPSPGAENLLFMLLGLNWCHCISMLLPNSGVSSIICSINLNPIHPLSLHSDIIYPVSPCDSRSQWPFPLIWKSSHNLNIGINKNNLTLHLRRDDHRCVTVCFIYSKESDNRNIKNRRKFPMRLEPRDRCYLHARNYIDYYVIGRSIRHGIGTEPDWRKTGSQLAPRNSERSLGKVSGGDISRNPY